MAHKLTLMQVKHLALLAKLELSDSEAERYLKELSEVLDYISILEKIDTEGLKPTNQVTGLQNVTRKDVVATQVAPENDLMALSPDTEDNYVKVKRMI